MINNNSYNYNNRNLSEVFKELQSRQNYNINKKKHIDTPIINSDLKHSIPTRNFPFVHIITVLIILFIINALFGKKIF